MTFALASIKCLVKQLFFIFILVDHDVPSMFFCFKSPYMLAILIVPFTYLLSVPESPCYLWQGRGCDCI